MSDVLRYMLVVAWSGMALGVVSGAIIGLFFTREDWMGGYNSHRRRLTRLGHIAFFGLGFVNFAYALTLHAGLSDPGRAWPAAIAFTIGAATMPACCFLCAWRKPMRHLFPVPVVAVSTGIVLTLLGLAQAGPGQP